MEAVMINNIQLTPKVYNNQRVVTFNDIDTVHNRPEGTARRNFNQNKQYFIENEDFYKITPNEFRTAIGTMDRRQNNDITLLTESGYLMVVKAFHDALAWEVQRQLVKCYFKVQEIAAEQHKEPAPVTRPFYEMQVPVQIPLPDFDPYFSEIYQKLDRIPILECQLEDAQRKLDYISNNLKNFCNFLLNTTEQQQALPIPTSNDFEKPKEVISRTEAPENYKDWQKKMHRFVDKLIARGMYKDELEAFGDLYNKLWREYGYVYKQEAKEYKERHKTEKEPSRLETIYESTLKNIFQNNLESMVANAYSITDPDAITEATLDDLIRPYAEMTHDTSKHNMLSFRKVYEQMEKISRSIGNMSKPDTVVK